LFLPFRARGKTDPRPNVSLAEFLFPPLGDRGKTDPTTPALKENP